MTQFRLAAISAAALLALSACEKQETDVSTESQRTSSDLFAYVPADTPYLAGNLQTIPDPTIDAYLERLRPWLEDIQLELSRVRSELEDEAQIEAAARSPNQHHAMARKLLFALVQEVDGKLNRAGMESLGLDLGSNKVVYGMGAFPVVRLGLSDAVAFRATVHRILEHAEINAPELEFQGVSYWRLGGDGSTGEPLGLYVSILNDHIALGTFPPGAELELLPAFLGLQMPADPDAVARLAGLNSTHGYTPYGSGILDLDRLAEEFLNPDSVIARTMAASGAFDPAAVTPECASEIRGIIGNMPRLTVGTSELTTDSVAMQYRIETKPTLAQELAGLVAEIPAANRLSRRILELSFGMRLGAARDFLRDKTAAIVENPF